MMEGLVEDLIQKGCKNKVLAVVAVQVYLELCEVKRYWDVEYDYSNTLEKIYFTARKKKNETPSIFVPIPVTESLSFLNLQNLCSLCADLDNQTVYIVIVNSDSTCVYYQVTNGLAKPLPLSKSKEDHSRKLDKTLKRNRELLQEAALYGISITLPKIQNTDCNDANTSTT